MSQDPQEKFNIREAKGDNYYKIMIVNEALKDFNSRFLYPWLLYIEIEIEDKTPKFYLPTDSESEILNMIEDNFTKVINESVSYQFIGRTTDKGKRELYYYLEDPKKVHEEISKIIDQNNYVREFEYSISKDPNWDKVSFFFNY